MRGAVLQGFCLRQQGKYAILCVILYEIRERDDGEMAFSEKLNGYWEEGYHYYMEFRDDRLTMREYRRKIILETTVHYDAEALDRGEETEIVPADPVFDRWPSGETAMEIRSLRWVDGELKMLENYTIMGEKEYTLRKVDGGPFRHIRIRDEEILPKLRGKWKEWTHSGPGGTLAIEGNALSWEGVGGGKIHAVSYDYDPGKVWLVPEDLTESGFGAFNDVEVRGNMLVTGLIVMDMSMPSSVFARAEDLDSIEVPESAKAAPRSTMGPAAFRMDTAAGVFLGMMNPSFGGMNPAWPAAKQKENPYVDPKPRFCISCGFRIDSETARFCPSCGQKQEGRGKYCPDCGHELEREDLKFCTECGGKL